MVRCGPRVARMGTVTALQVAIGGEVLAEIKRRRRTDKSVYTAIGLDPKTWRRYFVSPSRTLPMDVLGRVCTELDVSVSEVVARAEVNMVRDAERWADEQLRPDDEPGEGGRRTG